MHPIPHSGTVFEPEYCVALTIFQMNRHWLDLETHKKSSSVPTLGSCATNPIAFSIRASLNVRMKMNMMRIGMKVYHPTHGHGVVKVISEVSLEVDFESGRRVFSAADQDLKPAEPIVSMTGLDVPLPEFIHQTASAVLRELGVEKTEAPVEGLAARWRDGTLILKPADASLQTKEVPVETFFHKIVMMRGNLRVLEQKINSMEKLDEAEKIELQQYITRCYGSMTTFNVLFRNKEDQF